MNKISCLSILILFFSTHHSAMATSLDWQAKKTNENSVTPIVVTNTDLSQDETVTLTIATASNFKLTAQHIADKFSHAFGIPVSISSASTATLYQQILRGAPFDVFLSADQQHVQKLIASHKTAEHQGFVYAQGKLVFWLPDALTTPTLATLQQFNGRLAIANPKFAPYGIAAKQSLQSLQKWQSLSYVKGNNINQTYQFVESKNVTAGMVSYAAVVQKEQINYVIIPQKWYQPIQQVGIILNSKHVDEAALFRQFLLSESIQTYIQSQGYN